ncbi:MAG: hypothetical protein KC560_03345, partial [Myxococcales bacterium]|nr:hypothetical protein [Myxococcales bacterium]
MPSPADGIRAGVRLTTRVFARLALVPFAAFAFVALTSAPTWSGVGYVSCLAVMLAGLATLPEPATSRPRRRGLTRGAAVGLFVIACLRVGFVRDGARLHVLDSEAPSGGSRIASRVVDEGDAALTTTRLLVGLGAVRDDASELPAAMRAAYNEMRADHGAVPSPLVPTYLGLQGREAFDLVVIDPPAGAPRPRGALVFLHGFAGNFDLPCWQISRALAELA